MTIRAVISCQGQITAWECRQAIPLGVVANGRQARYEASVRGWSSALIDGQVNDFCPACTRRRLTGR